MPLARCHPRRRSNLRGRHHQPPPIKEDEQQFLFGSGHHPVRFGTPPRLGSFPDHPGTQHRFAARARNPRRPLDAELFLPRVRSGGPRGEVGHGCRRRARRRREAGSSPCTDKNKLLVDTEIASDANLKPDKFCDLALALPDQGRMLDDGIYRAIDVYLSNMRWIREPVRNGQLKFSRSFIE